MGTQKDLIFNLKIPTQKEIIDNTMNCFRRLATHLHFGPSNERYTPPAYYIEKKKGDIPWTPNTQDAKFIMNYAKESIETYDNVVINKKKSNNIYMYRKVNELKKVHNLIILQTDKNLGIAVVSKRMYLQNTYNEIEKTRSTKDIKILCDKDIVNMIKYKMNWIKHILYEILPQYKYNHIKKIEDIYKQTLLKFMEFKEGNTHNYKINEYIENLPEAYAMPKVHTTMEISIPL